MTTAFVAVLLATAVLVGVTAERSSAAGVPLYPDLKTLAPRELKLDRADITPDLSGVFHNVLRFSNDTFNTGDGPLIVNAHIDPTTKSGPSTQRVMNSDGTFTDLPLNNNIYWHQAHHHYHFDNWGRYQLWTKSAYDAWIASGRTVGAPSYTGVKTTSCITDEEFVVSAPNAVYPGPYGLTGCDVDGQSNIHMGLSVGWGDTYDWYRQDQWIDLNQNTLGSGTYVLRSVADPNNFVYESANKSDTTRESEAGNEATATFSINGSGALVDSNPPTGTVSINHVDATTTSTSVSISVIGRDDVSGVNQFRLSNNGTNFSTFNYTSSGSVPTVVAFNLADAATGGSSTNGIHTVYAQVHDNAGNWGPVFTDTINLQNGGPPPPPPSSYSQAVANDNPVSYWRLDETSGTNAADSRGSNPGVYKGSPTLGAASLLTNDGDKAVTFSGTSQSVGVASSGSLSLASTVSLEAWIKPTAIPAAGAFASVVTKPESYSLQLNGPKLEFTIMQGGTRRRLQAATGAIVAGTRYHIVGTYDGTTQRLYINGALAVSAALTGAITTNTNGLNIASWNGTSEFLAGTVDEVAVYPSVLSATQVSTHYSVGTNPSVPPTTQLTVSRSGTGTGTVTSSPAGITCGSTCAASYSSGATVTLTATPDAGSVFAGWSGGGCSGTGTCAVLLSANTTVTATFNVAPSTLTLLRTGAGSGNVTSAPAGIACGVTCAALFAAGTSVTLTATPAAGSVFSGWSGGGCSGTGTCTLTMNANTTVTATFAVATATLTVTPAGAGSGSVTSSPSGITCGATCSAVFNQGTSITLTAAPAAGSVFSGWSGGGCSGTGTCILTLNANTTVTPTFFIGPHTLTVAKSGAGTGTVTSAPGGISCGATCSASFAHGTGVTLTAAPAAGSVFSGWSGGGCSGTGTCSVTLNADTSVTATFGIGLHTLTVTPAGAGSGSVSSAPAGITCGVTCSASFAHGTGVTLTATPAAGSVFSGWSGGGCSGTGTCSVTLNGDTIVTASFFIAPHTLTVTPAGSGTGTVTSAPAGITCGATCAASFAHGASVTLTAAPDSSSLFAGWSGGGCSGTGTCTIALNADATVTATFDVLPPPSTLVVTPAGTGTGVVTSAPAGVDCGASCASPFTYGTSVTLTAAPDLGSLFAGWSGGGCSGAGTCTVVLTSDTTVTATFDSAPPATLTVTPAGAGSGSVTSAPTGIDCGVTCSSSFLYGTSATLTAVPAAGSVFAGWSGGGCNGAGTCTVSLTSDATVTATFDIAPSTLTVTPAGAGSGSVTSAPAGIACGATCSSSFAHGMSVTLTATPAAGSLFAGWSGGGCSGTATCTAVMDADTTITATFDFAPSTLTVTPAGAGSGSVMSAPAGIDCGVTCSSSFAHGTGVTLTATPEAGSVFSGWSGGGCSGTGTCSLTLNANATVTATFAIGPHTLTVTPAGAGSGSVSSAPAGIACGATCSASFAHGTSITLTATPAAGSVLASWSGGGCSGTGTCTVALNADTTVTATFNVGQTYAQVVTADAPAGYWRLDETTGTVAASATGTNTGAFKGSPTLGVAGLLASVSDKATAFSGANQLVSVPSSASLVLATVVSLEAWIKPVSLPAAGGFASVLTKPESYSLQFNGPRMEFTIMQSGTRRRLQAPIGAIVAGTKYHVVGTYDGATQRLYINGALVASAALTGAITTNTNALNIASWNGISEFLTGTVDEVAVYPSVLTQAQITKHYTTGTTVTAAFGSSSVADPAATTLSGTSAVATGVDDALGRIYVTRNHKRGSVSTNGVTVIDSATQRVVAEITTGRWGPSALAVDAVHHLVYVTAPTWGSTDDHSVVVVIDGRTNKIVRRIAVAPGPKAIAVNARTNRLYVTVENGIDAGQAVSVINGATGKLTDSIPTGPYARYYENPLGLAVDGRSNTIYATNPLEGTLYVIDGATNRIVRSLALGDEPTAVAVDPTTARVYVAHAGRGSTKVSVVDGRTASVVKSIRLGGSPRGIAVDASSGTAYVTTAGHGTAVVDTSTTRVRGLLDCGPGAYGVTVGADGAVIVADRVDDIVCILPRRARAGIT